MMPKEIDKPTVPQLMMDIVDESCELFHDGDVPYATILGSTRKTMAVDGKVFKRWIARQLYIAYDSTPTDSTLADGIRGIAGKAQFEGADISVNVRLAGDKDNVYIDLGDDGYKFVKISKRGWRIIDDAEVRFRRPGGLKALPHPVGLDVGDNGSLDRLREFINCSDDDWVLIVGWLIAAFRPTGPYPILLLSGEQGSAKSTTARILRSLVDPNSAALRATPRNEQDLAIACNNGWVQAFDNLSDVKPWLSDALCRIATGGGFAARTHYSNDEETLFDFQRPIILTSITDVASRSDLLDRSIMVQLNRIPEEARRTEADINAAFEQARPAIFGGLCNAISAALRYFEETHIDELPRMADAAVWVQAAEQALGWDVGRFNELYLGNREKADAMAIDGDLLASAIKAMMNDILAFSGTCLL